MQSYIGITGFTTAGEVLFAQQLIPPDARYQLMIGVLATYKSLRGLPMKEHWAKQTLRLEDIAGIFSAAAGRGTLNFVHYNADVNDRLWFCKDILEITSAVGPPLDGFQINMVWPSLQFLSAFHTLVPGRRRSIVLHVGMKAIEQVGGTPHMVARRLQNHVYLVDHILNKWTHTSLRTKVLRDDSFAHTQWPCTQHLFYTVVLEQVWYNASVHLHF